MSSLIVCRILASNYQANNHYNRADAKCRIFLVMCNVMQCNVMQCNTNLFRQGKNCHYIALRLLVGKSKTDQVDWKFMLYYLVNSAK